MQRIVLPRLGVDKAWRDAARACLAAGLSPEDVTFGQEAAGGLFDEVIQPPKVDASQIKVPKSFVSLAQSVVWHADQRRFDKLYACLHRLQRERGLMQDRADPLVQSLREMEKAVHRCQHKMKAFVRFREIGDPEAARRSFAAWFEPTHHTVEPTATFFSKRFADMDWRIVTPDVTAIFEAGALRFALDMPKPELLEDAHEDLWTTYFCNIFNPARLKVNAMTSEMPKKYWKNLPEAASIPRLISEAPARARAMAEAAPTLPPLRTARVQSAATRGTYWDGPSSGLAAALAGCQRCPLHCQATQVVAGEGPEQAGIMVVGEQPGDREDLEGRPFVGPAGQVLLHAMQQAGLQRDAVYLTNAVKHFKHEVRGKRRIHQTPDRHEVEHCRFWLDTEIRQVKPQIIVALGATAALALTGRKDAIAARRGRTEPGLGGVPALITYHPAHILRLPERADQEAARQALTRDLVAAKALAVP
ncbi:UdgX family uracil-DNA binding protein [Flavimaricola marinus]|uniref:Type-4 uracil-DNA glycosylase n=1 Tax=Flavimaricola marinus TaxID=1819565 RepID=A0A238L9F7_9RHOB|nr:UdgX family uracil-DNA binding protein [Flavimaricola marinus]SMY06319.1 Uracil DNA glycosylase superfamily protein [Flavimaricola marinus]